ncbi:MAG: hypothetical protein ACBR50_24740 [Microcoleus sp.]
MTVRSRKQRIKDFSLPVHPTIDISQKACQEQAGGVLSEVEGMPVPQ